MSAKSRLSVYLEPTLLRALERFALEHRKSKLLVAEAAISAFLAPDAVERPDAALIRRLDHHNRTAERADRNLAIVIEMLALFIRFWLTTTPTLPESAQAAARAKGQSRYDGFVVALGRRLAKGGRFVDGLSPDAPSSAAPRDRDEGA